MRIFKLLLSVILLAQFASAQETTVPVFLLRPSPTAGQLLYTPTGVGARPAWSAGLTYDGTDLFVGSNTVYHSGNSLWQFSGSNSLSPRDVNRRIQLGGIVAGDEATFSYNAYIRKNSANGLFIREFFTNSNTGSYGIRLVGNANGNAGSYNSNNTHGFAATYTVNDWHNLFANNFNEVVLSSSGNINTYYGTYNNLTAINSTNARSVGSAYMNYNVYSNGTSTNTTNNEVAGMVTSFTNPRGNVYGVLSILSAFNKSQPNYAMYNAFTYPANMTSLNNFHGVYHYFLQRGTAGGGSNTFFNTSQLDVVANAGSTGNNIVNVTGYRFVLSNSTGGSIAIGNVYGLDIPAVTGTISSFSNTYAIRNLEGNFHIHSLGGMSLGATDSRTQGRLLVTGADTLVTSFILRARNSNNGEALAVTGLRTVGVRTTVPSETLFVNGSFGATERSGTATSIAGWSSSNKAVNVTTGAGIDFTSGVISALDGSATNEAQTFSGSNSSGNALLSLTSVSGSGGGSYTLVPGTGVTFTHAANQVTISASAGGRTDFVIAGANTTVDSIGSGSWRRYTINADSSLWSVTSGQMWPNLVTKTNIGIRGLAATDTTTNSLVVSSGPAVLYGRYSNSNTNASRSYITAGASYGATANTPGLLFSVGDQAANGKSWRLAGAGNELRFSLYADGGTGTEVPFLTLRRNGLLPAFAIAQARVLVNKTTWGNRGRLEVNGAIHADTLKASLGAGTAGHIFTTYNTLGDGRWAPITGTNGVSVTWNGTSTVISGPGASIPIDSVLWSLNTSQASVFPKSTRKVSIGRAAPLNSYLLSVEAGTDGLNTWFNSRTTSNLVQFTNTSTGTTTTDGTEVGLINSLFKIQQKEAAAIDLIQGNGSNGGRITFNSTNSLQFRNTSGLIQAFLFQAYGTTTPLLNVDSRINTNQQAVEVGGAVSRNGINRTGSGGTEATIYHRAGARVFDGSTITGTTNNELHVELEETVTSGTGTKRFMIRVHGHSNDPQATSTPNATAFDMVFAKTFVNLTVQPTNTGKDANGGYYENVRWYVSSNGKPVCAFKINDGTTNDFLSAIVIIDTYAINDDGVTLNAPFVANIVANSGTNL